MLKIINLHKNYVLILSRFACFDGGKGFKYLNIGIYKKNKENRTKIFNFDIKDFNLIKF